VASWGQQQIQRVSGGVVINLLPTDGAPQGLALETNGSVIAGVNGATSTLVRLNPDGSWSNLVATGLSGSIAGIEISKYRFGAAPGSNTPPVMAVIPDFTIDEGSLLTFTAAAADADVPVQTLTFSLAPSAPEGASITAGGVFNWTPTAAQGPGNYLIGVKVTDTGAPPLSATNHFAVTVNELYLQYSASVAGPFLDEPAAIFDKPARTVSVSPSAATECFYRLRSNLPVRIHSLRLNGSEAFLEYQFQ
jgi:hypothetical protein